MEDLQKKTADTFDAFEERYSDAVNDAVGFTGLDVDFFTRVKADYIADLARNHFRQSNHLKALDIGCGVGNFHSLLTQHFAELSGVDVSEASIDKARQRHPEVNYSVYEGNKLPYADESFDLAFTICVMHHVPTDNWPNFVSEMRRVIRPGGLALVFEHNPLNPLTMRAVNNCPFDEDAVLLRSSKTSALFEEAGFDDVSARFILSVPAANGFMRGVDRVFSRLPLGAQYYVSAKRN